MPASHSLALPLSAYYAHNTRDSFSFFFASTSGTVSGDAAGGTRIGGSIPSSRTSPLPSSSQRTGGTDDAALDAYLDDLCAFLHATRLIQTHPDHYFQVMKGDLWEGGSTMRVGGIPVDPEELKRTQDLLRAFQPLLQQDGNAMAALRTLVRDGPPPSTPATETAAMPATKEGSVEDLVVPSTSLCRTSHDALASLHAFYATTRRLMLNRGRRKANDTATVTLLSPTERQAMQLSANKSLEQQKQQRNRESRILDLVVSHGMNPKKQHEVRIMRDTVRDLVACCNASTPQHHAGNSTEGCHNDASVRTTINIGEGKGYVSRAVALCDNLQVIGLDCNPSHKERAVERFETLVETSLSSRDGHARVNLRYVPRGHVASIVCRVEDKVEWASLLRGHVRTCVDPCCGITSASFVSLPSENRSSREVDAPTDGVFGASDAPQQDRVDESGGAPLARVRGSETVKLSCRFCSSVVRQESTTVIMKHIDGHLREVTKAAPPPHGQSNPAMRACMPTLSEVQEWNKSLSQLAYVAKLTDVFFQPAAVEAQHFAHRKDAAMLMNTRVDGCESAVPRSPVLLAAEEGVNPLSLVYAPTDGSHEGEGGAGGPTTDRHCTITLEPAYTARGYRVTLLLAAKDCAADAPLASTVAVTDTNGAALNPPGRLCEVMAAPSADAESQRYTFVEATATIVGYDGGVDRHQLCFDEEDQRRTVRLYRFPHDVNATAAAAAAAVGFAPTPGALRIVSDANGKAVTCIGAWRLPQAQRWAEEHIALLLTVWPPTAPSTPAVFVPSIRNTILIGLHPCGDLGSNVCRIFMDSAARGLLLVSCCWHALTPQGFPLSSALQRRGLTTERLSLLLATQPLDAWSTASPEGHRSSAKLLFFRSLFKLLWARLAKEWQERIAQTGDPMAAHSTGCVHCSDGATAGMRHCAFPDVPPHLEPTFLRRVSRKKGSLTFPQFASAVAAEYVFTETAKDTPYAVWKCGQRCPPCRVAQESLVRGAFTKEGFLAEMGIALEREHFAPFLGLTVLRMWMCHLVESILLLDRTLYVHERLTATKDALGREESSAVALVPLFDGALSPRMYGVLARRGGSACT